MHKGVTWTTPMTAVAGDILSADQFNTYIRDNLLETMVGQVSVAGQTHGVSGLNAISVRAPAAATVSTSETTTSTSFTDLATTGPTVTIDTGPSAFVMIAASMDNDTVDVQSAFSFAVSGASSQSASLLFACARDGIAATNPIRPGALFLLDTLTPGTNVFQMKYNVSSGTGTFANREIIVWPF